VGTLSPSAPNSQGSDDEHWNCSTWPYYLLQPSLTAFFPRLHLPCWRLTSGRIAQSPLGQVITGAFYDWNGTPIPGGSVKPDRRRPELLRSAQSLCGPGTARSSHRNHLRPRGYTLAGYSLDSGIKVSGNLASVPANSSGDSLTWYYPPTFPFPRAGRRKDVLSKLKHNRRDRRGHTERNGRSISGRHQHHLDARFPGRRKRMWPRSDIRAYIGANR